MFQGKCNLPIQLTRPRELQHVLGLEHAADFLRVPEVGNGRHPGAVGGERPAAVDERVGGLDVETVDAGDAP